jgi:uncharacterized repeat protein (TIGR02543 family)
MKRLLTFALLLAFIFAPAIITRAAESDDLDELEVTVLELEDVTEVELDDIIEVIRESAGSAGVSVSGKIRSYNPTNPTNLCLQGEDIAYTITIQEEPGSGQWEQGFTFSSVEPGTYTLLITKAAHTGFTVRNIVVKNADIDLTQNSRPELRLMTLRCGDINGDGNINNSDLTILWRQGNYNRSAKAADEPLCDLNGDGLINNIDLTILWLAYNYNRGEVIISALDYVTVGFDLNYDGAPSPPPARYIEAGELVILPDTPTRQGYIFVGWYSEDGEYYDFSKPVWEDITLYAQWFEYD